MKLSRSELIYYSLYKPRSWMIRFKQWTLKVIEEIPRLKQHDSVQRYARRAAVSIIEFGLPSIMSVDTTLDKLPKSMRDDEELVLIAVIWNSFNLEHVSDRLKSNEDVLIAAADPWGCSPMFYAPTQLKDDKAFAMKVLNTDANQIKFFSERIRNDKEAILLALEMTEYCEESILEHASAQIQQLVAGRDAKEALERAIASEKLAANLEVKLTQKTVTTNKMKI